MGMEMLYFTDMRNNDTSTAWKILNLCQGHTGSDRKPFANGGMK